MEGLKSIFHFTKVLWNVEKKFFEQILRWREVKKIFLDKSSAGKGGKKIFGENPVLARVEKKNWEKSRAGKGRIWN